MKGVRGSSPNKKFFTVAVRERVSGEERTESFDTQKEAEKYINAADVGLDLEVLDFNFAYGS